MKTLLVALIFFISLGIHSFWTNVFSQNITNDLSTGGLFKIKDAANDYLTLNQSTGMVKILNSIKLDYSTSDLFGIIYKGAHPFLHDFGVDNTFLGIGTGDFNMTGYGNTVVGRESFSINGTGNFNTALGTFSLFTNYIGSNNTALGYGSLANSVEGDRNTAVGNQSLFLTEIADSNTSVGYQSSYSNTTGFNNTAIGNGSLRSNTEGVFNTAVGLASLIANSTGDYNTALGSGSLLNGTGNFNTALGHSTASTTTTGNNVTCVGYNAEPSSGTISNQITLGNSSVTSLRCNVQTITSLSDARDKKNITDLTLGLDFLMKIRPRLFNWDKREWYDNNISDGSKMKEAPAAGFIAQELDEVQITENAEWLNLVLKDNPEKFEATSGNLLPVMVKAIQELRVESTKLKVESEKLRVENNVLKKDDKDIKQRLLKLEQTQNKLVSELEKFKSKESKISQINKGEDK